MPAVRDGGMHADADSHRSGHVLSINGEQHQLVPVVHSLVCFDEHFARADEIQRLDVVEQQDAHSPATNRRPDPNRPGALARGCSNHWWSHRSIRQRLSIVVSVAKAGQEFDTPSAAATIEPVWRLEVGGGSVGKLLSC